MKIKNIKLKNYNYIYIMSNIFYLITTGISDDIYLIFDDILESILNKCFKGFEKYFDSIEIIHFDRQTSENLLKKLNTSKNKFNIISEVNFINDNFNFDILDVLTNNMLSERTLLEDKRNANHLILDFAHIFTYHKIIYEEQLENLKVSKKSIIIPKNISNNKYYFGLNCLRFGYPYYKSNNNYQNIFMLEAYKSKPFKFILDNKTNELTLITFIDRLNYVNIFNKLICDYIEYEPCEIIYNFFYKGSQSLKYFIEQEIKSSNNLKNLFELDEYLIKNKLNINYITNKYLINYFELLYDDKYCNIFTNNLLIIKTINPNLK
jgi:hypothetical protein